MDFSNQPTPRVLSIQSHVVSGYVGNKCATFPMQLLGFEVDTINSVQFSNHTGYKCWKGQILDETQLEELFQGLELNEIHRGYKYLLTGYVGSESFLKKIVEVVQKLKKVVPDLLFVCDPVMGDNGKLYVPEENLPVYRDMLLPLADILTPNQFEAELLTGIKITSQKEALRALDDIHQRGVKTVVITSTTFPTSRPEDGMWGYASQLQRNGGVEKKYQIRFNIPIIQGSFTGSGDLFASLFLAWYNKTGEDLKGACEKTASTLHHVLTRTSEAARVDTTATSRAASIELKMIESKRDIENPKIVVITEQIG